VCYVSNKKKVWACLSEDMDMFVYGCNKVIRYLSLMNHTVVIYDTKEILNDLGITQKELREICILSGTDYNNNLDVSTNMQLYNVLKWFKKYHHCLKKREKEIKTEEIESFYQWLKKNNYIEEYEKLMNIYNMFDIDHNKDHLKEFENIKIMNGNLNKENLKNILKKDGFLFP